MDFLQVLYKTYSPVCQGRRKSSLGEKFSSGFGAVERIKFLIREGVELAARGEYHTNLHKERHSKDFAPPSKIQGFYL